MRGHIIKRAKDSYSIVLSLGNDPATGKRRRQWLSVKGTKKDAEKRLAELLRQVDTGTFMKPGKTTVADYLKNWLSDYVKPNLSPRGFERYESIVRVYLIPALGGMPLIQVRPEHIQKHYSAMLNKGLSALSVRYHHVVLHKALQTALQWGLVNRNAADGAMPPKARRSEMQTWDKNETNRFLEAAKGTIYYPLFYTALFTGMRRSELLALRWQDIDLIFGQVSVSRGMHHLRDGTYVFTEPKSTKSRRTIALPPSAILALSEHRTAKEAEALLTGKPLTDTDLVFSVAGVKPLRPNSVSRAWKNLAARAGVKVIRFHDARHTHASLMLKQGIHPKIVQERLGHASIQVTLDTYSHVAPGLQQAAALRFDEALTTHYNEYRDNEIVGKIG